MLFGLTFNVQVGFDVYNDFFRFVVVSSFLLHLDDCDTFARFFLLSPSCSLSLRSYTSGVYTPSPAAVFVGGHSVKITGWGTDEASKLPYWVVANSWATTWGMQGFFHILRGNNTCGIEKNSIWGLPKL